MNKHELFMERKSKLIEEWTSEIKKSWTWARLTEAKRNRFLEVLNCQELIKNLYGTDTQIWIILNRFYSCFLQGLGNIEERTSD